MPDRCRLGERAAARPHPGRWPTDDGRPGIDRESVGDDVETIQGSNFDDVLFGSRTDDLLRGLDGDDTIGGGGADVIDEGPSPNGDDFLNGGDGPNDRVTYGSRTSGVRVSLDGVRNDGATGENDDVRQSVERVSGTNFNDVLSGNSLANSIDARAGNDTIDGLGGDDSLTAGAGNNGVVGGTGNDVIFARNGEIDNIDCSENRNDSDTAERDTTENRVVGCERGQVGVLRLSPKRVRAVRGRASRGRAARGCRSARRRTRALARRALEQQQRVSHLRAASCDFTAARGRYRWHPAQHAVQCGQGRTRALRDRAGP